MGFIPNIKSNKCLRTHATYEGECTARDANNNIYLECGKILARPRAIAVHFVWLHRTSLKVRHVFLSPSLYLLECIRGCTCLHHPQPRTLITHVHIEFSPISRMHNYPSTLASSARRRDESARIPCILSRLLARTVHTYDKYMFYICRYK